MNTKIPPRKSCDHCHVFKKDCVEADNGCRRCSAMSTACTTDGPLRDTIIFNSIEFLSCFRLLKADILDDQSTGRNTYILIQELNSSFSGVSRLMVNKADVDGFLVYFFKSLGFPMISRPGHPVWSVAKSHKPTLKALQVHFITS